MNKVKNTDSTVYMLNSEGSNVFYANIQPGHLDDGTRLTHEQQVKIAELIAEALNTPKFSARLSEVIYGETHTFFEYEGYTKDTKFKVLLDYEELKVDDIVTLYEDDGSTYPYFKTEDGRTGEMCIPGYNRYPYLEVVSEE